MTEITAKTPWAGHTGDVPLHLDYFDGSMFEALELVAKRYPRNIAFDFMGKPTTYPQMIIRGFIISIAVVLDVSGNKLKNSGVN